MKKYLLDTTALIDFSKGRKEAVFTIQSILTTDCDVGVCLINVAEFFAGVPQEKRKEWETFFRALSYWNISISSAIWAGRFRHEYKKRGRQVTTADALIAAVSIQEKATLVTNNLKDYPMKELSLLQLDSTET